MSRRSLLRSGAVAAGVFSIVPPHVLAQAQRDKKRPDAPPPSETIAFAAVGAGGQAAADIDAISVAGGRLVGFADVDRRRSEKAETEHPDARQFVDYREMLDALGDKVDAVLVATPDHSHAVAVMAALRRKKHVFCEKPLAHSVAEVRALTKAAAEQGVVTQLGNQGHASGSIRQFRSWVEEGAIGDVHTVHAGCKVSNNAIDTLPALAEKHEVPDWLDWDVWLGPAEFRLYHPAYLPGKWRRWRPFGTGTIGDWTCHVVDPVFWALDLGAPQSVCVERADGWDPDKHRDTFPRGSVTRFVFPAKNGRGPVTLLWHDGTEAIPTPDNWADLAKDQPNLRPVDTGALVYGDRGTIMYGSHGAGGARILPKADAEAHAKKAKPHEPPPRGGHYSDFIQAIRNGRKAGSDFAYGGPLTEIALVGAIAQLFPGQELKWDAAQMRFPNNEAATKLLTPTFRKGWSL